MSTPSTDVPTGTRKAEGFLKPITITVATARRISGLGNTTLWALIKDHKLEAVRIGRRTLVTFRSLEALLAPRSGSESQRRRRGRPRKVRTFEGATR
jgi:excisionase family DNA binding protein